jgi:hypothetical protein
MTEQGAKINSGFSPVLFLLLVIDILLELDVASCHIPSFHYIAYLKARQEGLFP